MLDVAAACLPALPAVLDGQEGWVHAYEPSLEEAGVERLTVEFADHRYCTRYQRCWQYHLPALQPVLLNAACSAVPRVVSPPRSRDSCLPAPAASPACSPSRYAGHGTDRGYNAIGFHTASNVWARQVGCPVPGRSAALPSPAPLGKRLTCQAIGLCRCAGGPRKGCCCFLLAALAASPPSPACLTKCPAPGPVSGAGGQLRERPVPAMGGPRLHPG